MNKKIKQKVISVLVLTIILIIAWFQDQAQDDISPDLFVYYLNVGQGDSALIESPNGVQVLIDAGKGDAVIKELENIMPFWDRDIDILVLSHGDLDHIGGFFDILDSYEVGQIIRADTVIDSKYLEELLRKARDSGISIQELGEGDKIILDQTNGIYFDIYSPVKESLLDENETSLVMELIYHENEFLFTGDATTETELNLIKKYSDKINSDILKVGHHGSKTSTSELFLEKVTPDYSILSYGENSYGHPNSEVLERLGKLGGQIFETKDRATIVARSDENSLEVYSFDHFNEDWSLSFISLLKAWIPN